MYSDIISLFGGYLSKIISKPIPACRGVFRLAIYDLGYKEKMFDIGLNYDELNQIISNSLKKRLLRLHVINLDEVIIELKRKLMENQAFLTMMHEN